MSSRRKVGPWQVASTQIAYDNPWIEVTHNKVIHPGGTPGVYGVVSFRNLAVGILAICDDGRIPLVGQHRFPLDRFSWELPEGGGPLDEPPLETGRRELAEETGYSARNWHRLIDFDVSNSVTDERAACFLAWGLTPGPAAPEDSEALSLRYVTFAELLSLCLDGTITDSLTLMMTFAAEQRSRRGELPGAVTELIAPD